MCPRLTIEVGEGTSISIGEDRSTKENPWRIYGSSGLLRVRSSSRTCLVISSRRIFLPVLDKPRSCAILGKANRSQRAQNPLRAVCVWRIISGRLATINQHADLKPRSNSQAVCQSSPGCLREVESSISTTMREMLTRGCSPS